LPINAKLSIDLAWFGAENPRRVLIHSSGLHGVEGFAGSAIQLQLLDNMPALPEDTALVLVHTLNPYGMSSLRRFNENNVDLNRNFMRPDEKYAGAPELYEKLNPLLNPRTPPSRDLFYLRAAALIPRYGMRALKEAVVGGQYEFPNGLFFGGKGIEPGPQKYRNFLTDRLKTTERLISIDVHTGIGDYAEDLLMIPKDQQSALRPLLGERIAAPDEGDAYQVRGSMDAVFPLSAPKAKVFSITQEFGTYNPVRVLQALREENRWHQFGSGGIDHPVKQNLKEAFFPEDHAWRVKVLNRGQELIREVFGILTSR
jgi:hypothetical protein